MMSTGSPLAPESFDYVYEASKQICISPRSPAARTSAAASCWAIPKPVYRGEIQGPALGIRRRCLRRRRRTDGAGKGELVCRKPFPSMPIGFWNDPDDERYRAAYFERFPNIWHHGDFAEWTEHGGIIIHGRSDATLNPGGVRIGTAEIYRQVEQLERSRKASSSARTGTTTICPAHAPPPRASRPAWPAQAAIIARIRSAAAPGAVSTGTRSTLRPPPPPHATSRSARA